MVLWIPVNRAMLCGDTPPIAAAEIDRYASAGARAFLDAYGETGGEAAHSASA
jgi:TetR/AcrR family transcriptional regulator, mexJK operon transcriptional repressor